MRFTFLTDDLADLYAHGSSRYHPHLIKAFRRVIDVMASAPDERTLRGIKGLRMEKLQGERRGQFSVRITDQYRLIFSIEMDEAGHVLLIIEMVDYH